MSEARTNQASARAHLPGLWLATASVFVLLLGCRQALALPGGFDIESMLGWSDPAAVGAAVETWGTGEIVIWQQHLHPRYSVAAQYLWMDTALFMPLYGVTLWLTLGYLGKTVRPQLQRARLIEVAGKLALLALLVVDFLENLGGLSRIDAAWWEGPLMGLAGCVAAATLGLSVAAAEGSSGWPPNPWWALPSLFPVLQKLAHRWRKPSPLWRMAGVGAGLALLIPLANLAGAARCDEPRPSVSMSWAHDGKGWLALAVLGSLSLLAGAEQLGIGLDGERRAARARVAAGRAAVVWRTRYTLLMLAVVVALLLGLDQARDVMIALAGDSLSNGWAAVVLLITAGAFALLAYVSWLWTRLVCRVQSPATPPLAGGPQRALEDRRAVGVFARGWARAVSLVPLFAALLLVSLAFGDAIRDTAVRQSSHAHVEELQPADSRTSSGQGADEARTEASAFRDSEPLRTTLIAFGLFALLTVGFGGWFIDQRIQKGSARVQDYYRSVRVEAALRRFRAWPPLAPRFVPLGALALILVLRFFGVLAPEAAAEAPYGLALIVLSSVWWISAFALLALVETAQARPWGLLVVAVIGGFAALGWTENHLLADYVASSTRQAGAFVSLGLAAGVGLSWWLAFDAIAGRKTGRPPRYLWGVVAGAFIVLPPIVANHVQDSACLSQARPAQASQRPPLRQALDEWLDRFAQLPPEPVSGFAGFTDPVFLIASEGGGIRSAYWTARVLLELRDQYDHFDERVVAISGVSGGAFGAAVYSACLRRRDPKDTPLEDCIRDGFASLDPLSPLAATWMFEDALAPAWPASKLCRSAACGHLSRAIPFEREWVRAFRGLDSAVADVQPGQPQLLLNGTWVESGEPALVSSFSFDARTFPGVRDVQGLLGRQLSLVTGAHLAARFPFVNPLAAIMQPRSDEVVGRIADGGYTDNSGAVSLGYLWNALEPLFGARKFRPVLILIRNGQRRAACDDVDRQNGPPEECIRTGASNVTPGAELESPAARDSFSLYPQLFGPAVAVLNSSGVGANGRRAAAQLRAEIGPDCLRRSSEETPGRQRGCTLIVDQLSEGPLVPLGWYLSRQAREALDAQAVSLGLELEQWAEQSD